MGPDVLDSCSPARPDTLATRQIRALEDRSGGIDVAGVAQPDDNRHYADFATDP
jgi:hypothetical protein